METNTIISDFVQGGFYVNSGSEYASAKEIRSGWIDTDIPGSPASLTISVDCGDLQWSFICCDAQGKFRNISKSLGYKNSGTEIDLSDCLWVKKIRIELHSDNGLTPPQSCTLNVNYTYAWTMKNGFPVPTFAPDLSEKAVTESFPVSLWRVDKNKNGGYPFTGLMPIAVSIDMWSLEREVAVIRVYDISEPQEGFDHNGLAVLMPISCQSRHNDDVWEIRLSHPLDDWGKWNNLLPQNVLKVDGQLFRIDTIESEYTENGGIISVHAHHITEDMADDLIERAEFGGGNAMEFMDFCMTKSKINPDADPDPDDCYYKPYEFECYSDIETIQPGSEYVNTTLWGAIVGVDNCIINRYGGELYRNNFYFSVCKRMENARDNAFFLRYSLDMTKIKQTVDYTDFCTNLDCTDNFGNGFSISYTNSERWAIHHPKRRFYQFTYAEDTGAFWNDVPLLWGKISFPKITYELDIASLRADPRYADFMELQDYKYGDSGTIYCPELDVQTIQKITEIEKDELTGDIKSMILGNTINSLARPSFLGATVSSGRTAEDKQERKLQNMLIGMSIKNAEKYTISRLEELTINALQGE